MSLEHGESYAREEAIEAAAPGMSATMLADDQFAVLPKHILCFFDIDTHSSGSFFSSPSELRWVPPRHDYEPDGEWPFIPKLVRETYDRSGDKVCKIRDHHLFVRRAAGRPFLYVGFAHLGSYGGGNGEFSANFSLERKISKETWLKFGGYAGWMVSVQHEDRHVAEDDLASFRMILAEALKDEYTHVTLTRYEEDSLNMHLNPDSAWLMYLRDPLDTGLYPAREDITDPERLERFRCGCGIDLEFPARMTVARDDAARIMEEFFSSRELPTSVRWAED